MEKYKLNSEKKEVKVLIKVFNFLLKDIVKEHKIERNVYA